MSIAFFTRWSGAGLFVLTALLAGSAAQFAAAANNDDRTIEFVNMCPSTVRIGVNGAALLASDTAERLACSASTPCPNGASCLITGTDTSGTCYFDFPDPSSGTAVLSPPDGATNTATYDLTNPVWSNGVIVKGGVNNIAIKWSGNVYASTNCDADGNNCQTGMCPMSSGGKASVVPCHTGVGPQGPTTLAEFTFSNTGVDFYDISMVNGANIPVSMEPTAAAASNPNAPDPYWCATPGSTKSQSGGLPACDWSFGTKIDGKDQSDVLRAVTGGGAACTSNASCTGDDVCGYSYAVGTTGVMQSCGAQIGWWNANEFCAFTNGGFGDPINCSTAVAGQGTNRDLFQCIGANAASCYGAGGDACCGCPKWKVGGTAIPLAPGFTCNGTNKSWSTIAEPWVNFNKQACPTAYSFPFDDASSTFTCSTEASPTVDQPNAMNYTITFCPDGKTGF